MIQTSKTMSTTPTQLFRFPQTFIKEAREILTILIITQQGGTLSCVSYFTHFNGAYLRSSTLFSISSCHSE